MVLGVWKWWTDVCGEQLSLTRYVDTFIKPIGKRRKRSEKKLMHEESVEMKLVVAAIYTNFLTTIVDDEGIEATDAYTVKPSGHKLILKFELI